jgi:hypothetical protein
MQRNGILIALAAVLILLLGSSAWVIWTTPSGPPPTSARPSVLRCSECNAEIIYVPQFQGKTCSHCHRGKMEPFVRSLREGEEAAPFYKSPLVVGFLVVLVVLCLVHGYFWLRARPRSAPVRIYSYCRCPGCKRRVRYIEKVGQRSILCPTCRRELDLVASRT